MKITIVGAGIVGLSCAWALSARGHDVVVLDQGPIPNPQSASLDQHRMIRPHYGAQTGYTRMVGQANGAWDRLWQDLGESYYAKTGVLALDLGDRAWMEASHKALIETATPFVRLGRDEIERYAPVLAVPDEAWGLFTPQAGVLFADRIVLALAKWLTAKGVELRANSEVTGIDANLALVTLKDGQEIAADRLVVAAGAWTPYLLGQFQDLVQPVRSSVAYVAPPAEMKAAWESGPALFMMTKGAHLYSLPPADGSELKFGGAPILRAADPREPVEVLEEEQQFIKASFAPYLKNPQGYRALRGAGACYADPADKRFITEQLGNSLVITGCGGRMFKFGALFGLRAADVLEGSLSPDDLKDWAAGRIF